MSETKQSTGNIPIVDLQREYRLIEGDVNQAIKDVFDRGHFILGENVRNFEMEFSTYCEAGFGIGVASGTDALQLALRACDIGAGDEVITVANTAFPTAIAISYTGAKPVFVDIDHTFTIDVTKIEEKISGRTKAIIPVHLYGQPADMDVLIDIAKQYKIRVIEDACQAHGAEYKGKKVGSIGNIGCFSFYPTKNLGAYGDAGIIVTSSEEIAQRLKLLRDYGQVARYEHVVKGYNSRLDELQAAILRVKLRKLDEWNEKRCQHAKMYDKLLTNSSVITPVARENAKHVYHLYVIRTPYRDQLQHRLKEHNVTTDIHYPTPIHLQKAYTELGLEEGSLPVTEQYANEILSLPVFPGLTDSEIEYCVEIINKFSPSGLS